MGKLILLGVTIFFVVGIIMERILDTVFSPEAEAEFNRTANQFIAAQQEGEAIPARPQSSTEQRRKAPTGQIGRANCDAGNIYTQNPHPPMVGTVTGITDGDTLKAAVDGIEMKIKLWGIDSPEMDQDHGTGAQRNLGAITPSGTRITIHPLTMDQYGQVVGTVGEPGEWSVNFLMVAQGWAYHYQEFSAKGNRCFLEAERLARDNRLGVWRGGSEGQTRPWDHRRTRNSQGLEAKQS